MFPFAFLAQLISAGTLVAFMFVSLAMYRLRKREGKDLPIPAFKLRFISCVTSSYICFSIASILGLEFEEEL